MVNDRDWVSAVKAELERTWSPYRMVTAPVVAGALGVCDRTLYRYLDAVGTSFLRIRMEMSLQRAVAVLEAGGSVAEATEAACLNRPQALRALFRRHGLGTPRQVRLRCSSQPK